MNLARNLERSAFFFPGRPALCEGFSEIRYAELREKANRIATALIRMDVKPGDHVGLCTPNSGDWLAFYFGVLKAGAVPVTLSSVLKKDELHAYLKSRLSSFKVPKEYRLVEDFPKSPAGKILKRELKKLTQESGR